MVACCPFLLLQIADRFPLITTVSVLQIADQLLERADTLHARHLIHRDIKPVSGCTVWRAREAHSDVCDILPA